MIALVGAPALQADAAVIPEGIYAGERSLGGMEEDDRFKRQWKSM